MRSLLIGRFQPFHLGHARLAARILSDRPGAGLVLAIGSAQESFTLGNPFTASERFEMVERAMRDARLTGWVAVPVPDIQRHAQWVAYVTSLVPTFDRVYTNNPLTQLLFERAGFEVARSPLEDRARLEGTRIRRLLADGGDWASALSPSVAAYLTEIRAPDRLKTLARPDGGAGGDARP